MVDSSDYQQKVADQYFYGTNSLFLLVDSDQESDRLGKIMGRYAWTGDVFDKITFILFRTWNAVKFIFHTSDWKSTKTILCEIYVKKDPNLNPDLKQPPEKLRKIIDAIMKKDLLSTEFAEVALPLSEDQRDTANQCFDDSKHLLSKVKPDQEFNRIKKIMNNYTCTGNVFDRISYRIWNAVKSIFHISDWESTKTILCEIYVNEHTNPKQPPEKPRKIVDLIMKNKLLSIEFAALFTDTESQRPHATPASLGVNCATKPGEKS